MDTQAAVRENAETEKASSFDVIVIGAGVAGLYQRWLGESEQSDKWFPCLIAALLPRSRREHVETITTEP